MGAFALIRRSAAARTAFAVSMTSALVYYAYVFGLSGTLADRPAEEFPVGIMVMVVTAIFTVISFKTRLD